MLEYTINFVYVLTYVCIVKIGIMAQLQSIFAITLHQIIQKDVLIMHDSE